MALACCGQAALAHGPASSHAKLDHILNQLGQATDSLRVEAGCFTEPTAAGREEGGLCADLYQFSCAPGEWNDGTGTAGSDELVNKKVAALKAEISKKATKDFLGALKTPKGAYLRKLALSAFGMSFAPGCEGPGKSANCDRILAEALGAQVTKNLLPRGRPGGAPGEPRPASLRGLDMLIQNAAYRRLEMQYSAEAKKALRDSSTEKKIETKIFPKVQKLLVDLIRRKVPDPKAREILATKVAGIEFGGADCAAPVPPDATGDSYDPALSAMLEPNAFYTPAKNSFRFCNGFLLRNKSEFQIASVVAHELAHAIDPCLITHGPKDFRFSYADPLNRERSEAEYPFPNLLACLRGEGSMRAEFRPAPAPSLGVPAEGEGLPAKLASLEQKIAALNVKIVDEALSRQDRERLRDEKTMALSELARVRRRLEERDGFGAEGGFPPAPENAFCQEDQIGESLSDWIAGEILPAYVKQNHTNLSSAQRQVGFANVFRGMCQEGGITGEGPPRFDVHPETYLRANQLLLAQPEVRRQMGCPLDPPAGVTYCEVPDVKGAR
ncbi:MAG: hypothetical protein EOP11_05275 [Proteobacteria bacterium]|nr:MAG: hypothetical protein EOP11_05275 [Pseudomonadota bacterium]